MDSLLDGDFGSRQYKMAKDETEYSDEFAAGLELMWGQGFLSPGGPEEVALIVEGIDVSGKRALDIGSGLGGPAMCLVSRHNAEHVTGIDLDALNVERATNYATSAGLIDRTTFITVDGGDLPFDDGAFDIAFSKDAITEAPNKSEIFAEAFRVLRPGGWLAMSDWFRGREAFTPEMKDWLKAVGVTLEMTTIDDTADELKQMGFDSVKIEDRNAWYQTYSKGEVDRMSGDDRPRFEALLGSDQTEEWIRGTKLKTEVVAQGQLRPGHIRARRP